MSVNRVLEKLFVLIANNRIPMRNAGLLAYVGSLLLNSVPQVKNEMYQIKGSAAIEAQLRRAYEIIESRIKKEEDDSDDEGAESETESKEESEANVPAETAAKSA
jgi:hypothetical protein